MNVEVDLVPLNDDVSAATMRYRKADEDSDHQLV